MKNLKITKEMLEVYLYSIVQKIVKIHKVPFMELEFITQHLQYAELLNMQEF